MEQRCNNEKEILIFCYVNEKSGWIISKIKVNKIRKLKEILAEMFKENNIENGRNFSDFIKTLSITYTAWIISQMTMITRRYGNLR